jgi:hypothetical protein
MNSDEHHAMFSHELQSALMLTVEFSKSYYEVTYYDITEYWPFLPGHLYIYGKRYVKISWKISFSDIKTKSSVRKTKIIFSKWSQRVVRGTYGMAVQLLVTCINKTIALMFIRTWTEEPINSRPNINSPGRITLHDRQLWEQSHIDWNRRPPFSIS